MTEEQKQSIGQALGRVVSGVYILTARQGDQTAAMMASWVMQAGFNPPTVSIAIAMGRPIAQMIRATNQLALSILPSDDKTLMKHFVRIKAGDDPFAGVSIKPASSGLPILTDALGYLDCQPLTICDFGGDHELIIARIEGGEMLREGTAFEHQRGSGFHY